MDVDPLMLVFGISIFGVIVALYFARYVLQQGKGNEKMQAIADAIREGAEAFIRRQYTTIAVLAIIAAIVIYVGYGVAANKPEVAWKTAFSFIVGAACSAIAGVIGMWIAVRANLRTAAAVDTSISHAITIAMRYRRVDRGCGAQVRPS